MNTQTPRHCLACDTVIPDRAAFCPTCGTAVGSAVTGSGSTTLPPIPDGGLAAVLPAWLRRVEEASPAATAELAREDPSTWLTADDIPAWIRAAMGLQPMPPARPDSQAAEVATDLSLPPGSDNQPAKMGHAESLDQTEAENLDEVAGQAEPEERPTPPLTTGETEIPALVAAPNPGQGDSQPTVPLVTPTVAQGMAPVTVHPAPDASGIQRTLIAGLISFLFLIVLVLALVLFTA